MSRQKTHLAFFAVATAKLYEVFHHLKHPTGAFFFFEVWVIYGKERKMG